MRGHFCSGTMRPPHNQAIPKPTDVPLFPFWVEDRGLSFLLAFLILITIFVPMIPLSRSGRIVLDLILAFMLFSGAIATIRHRSLMYLVVAVTVLEFTADLIVEFNPLLGHLAWDTALKVSGMAILIVMTLRQAFRSARLACTGSWVESPPTCSLG
jgi:hypothetical protein